jgi:hypothetical protein
MTNWENSKEHTNKAKKINCHNNCLTLINKPIFTTSPYSNVETGHNQSCFKLSSHYAYLNLKF